MRDSRTLHLKMVRLGVRIVPKRGPFWIMLHYLVIAFTLGKNRRFLSDYYTTIGPWIGVPESYWHSGYTDSEIITLEHELIHVHQCKRWGLGNVYLGIIPFSVFYLLFPLPFGLAYFRYRFEREAYAHGIRVGIRLGRNRAAMVNHAVGQLTSGAYGWTWPFKVSVRKYLMAHT